MSTLDSLLQYKSQQDAIQQNNASSISKAVDTFNQLRQQGIQNKMSMLQTRLGAAQSGISIGSNGELSYNPSLLNPLSQIMAGAKLQADAKTAENPQLYQMAASAINRLMGNNSSVQPAQGGFQTSQGNIPIGQQQQPSSTSIDSFMPPSTSTTSPSPTQMTPMSASIDPISGLPTVQAKNVQGEAQSAAISKKATDLAGAQSDAEIGQARDGAQMQLIAQSIKNMNNIHKELSEKGFAGNVYGPAAIANLDKIPTKGLQDSLVPPEVQKLAGQFNAARNETLVKVQPILSQQFGQAGSTRIMDSLINLSKGEFGDLNTPHAQFEGQASGSLGSLYRIKLAGDKYLTDLKSQGQSLPKDEKTVTDEIYKRMGDLTPDQNKQLQDMTNNVLGKSSQPPSGAAFFSKSTGKYYDSNKRPL